MRENFNYTNADQDNDNIDFAKLFRFILMQSKLILSMVFISFFISLALYITADKNYKITSLIQVDTDNTDILDITNTLGNINASTEIPNLITLYKSRTNILKLINDLKMNIDIKNIEYKSMIDINFKELDNSNEISTTIYLENILDKINVFDENKDLIGQYKENEKFEYKGLVISIDRFNKSIKERIEIDYKSPSLLYPAIKQKLVLESNSARNSWYQSREGLIEVSYVTNDVAEGKNIINYANKIFLDYRVLVETEKARKAIDFIDKNIESLKKILDSNKRRLKDFREKNQSINVDLEIQKVIERIQSIDNELDGVEIELANAADRYTENNPIFLNLIKKREILATQKEDILVQINRLPKEQQDYIDLFNEVENSQEVFEELESRRLGFSIIEASTMGNVRIVDDAYKAYLVSPQLINVLITPIIFFLFGCILAIFRGFNFLPITNPAELFDNNLNQPITGVIPLIEDTSDTSSNHQLNSSIESLIVNLRSIKSDNNDKKVISISSPSPANGKSLISKLLAEKLASIGSRVMLIDNDLKRGQLTKVSVKKILKKISFMTFQLKI